MNKNIINFYIITNKLKDKIRSGWKQLKISSDRLESVAEHIYGCLMLAIAIDSEYKLELDMYKVIKMIALHELEETIMEDYTIRDGITKDEKIKLGKECVNRVTHGLIKKNEIVALLDEFTERQTKEAIFCYHIDKIECNFQAKLYDLRGQFSLEEAIEDAKCYMNKDDFVVKEGSTASDIGIEYDKIYFKDDKLFEDLINDIQDVVL